jgi:hypothetical protein
MRNRLVSYHHQRAAENKFPANASHGIRSKRPVTFLRDTSIVNMAIYRTTGRIRIMSETARVMRGDYLQ